MTDGADEPFDPYDPAYINRSVFGGKMKGHRQTWPDIDLDELKAINPDCVGWLARISSESTMAVPFAAAADDRLIVCSTCSFLHEPYDMFAAFAVVEEVRPA